MIFARKMSEFSHDNCRPKYIYIFPEFLRARAPLPPPRSLLRLCAVLYFTTQCYAERGTVTASRLSVTPSVCGLAWTQAALSQSVGYSISEIAYEHAAHKYLFISSGNTYTLLKLLQLLVDLAKLDKTLTA